jgi:hypothetical protein
VNEVDLIRAQLTDERAHVRQIAAAWEAPGDRGARRDYLLWVLETFEARDLRLLTELRSAGANAGGPPAELAAALAQAGSSREALARLPDAVRGSHAEWRAFAQLIAGAWDARRERLEKLLRADTRPGLWRSFAGLDADCILEERARFVRARDSC